MKRSEINDFIKANYDGMTDDYMSLKCNISLNAIQLRRKRLRLVRDQDVTVEKALEHARVREDKASEKKLRREALTLAKDAQDERDAALEIKRSSSIHHIIPHKTSGKTQAVAFAIASDWHVEEEVRKESIPFAENRYTLGIARKRADEFFVKVVRLTQREQRDVKIDQLVLALLGDFITGRIHEENLEICVLRPMDAIIFVQELLESGIVFILKNLSLKLTIVCHVGNHSRMTRQVHATTETGNSLEFLMYHNLKLRFKDEDRVEFIINESYHTYLDVFGTTIRFHHGHAVRYGGGIGGLTIPLLKAIHQWNLTHPADVDVLGHFHDYMTLRRAVVNGSMIGYNAYALRIKAEFQRPIQSWFLVDNKRGKTVHIPIMFST